MWLQGDDNGGTYSHAGMFAAISAKLAFFLSGPHYLCAKYALRARNVTNGHSNVGLHVPLWSKIRFCRSIIPVAASCLTFPS